MYEQFTAVQHGLITFRQLVSCGLTATEIEVLVEHRVLTRWRRGVFRVTGAPMTPEVPVLAAVLAGGAKNVASHRASALVHRLDGFVCRQPEITAWGGSHPRLAGVRTHRVVDLPAWQRTVVNNVPVTTVARTFVDLAGTRPDEVFGRSFADARRRLLVTPAEVLRCAEGRTEMQQVHRIMARQVEGRTDSDFEARVYWVLAEAGLPLPVQQLQVVVPEGVYLLDHGYPPPLKVDVEIKGFGHAQDRTVFDRDSFRRVHLRRAGWIDLQITTAWTDRNIVDETRAILLERGWQSAA